MQLNEVQIFAFLSLFFILRSAPFGEVMLNTGGKDNLRRTGRRIVRRLLFTIYP